MTFADAAQSGLLVCALVRRGPDLLMVREDMPGDPHACWVPPGGQVEPGELVHDALVRELREETGLRVPGPARLAFVSQYTVTGDPSWDGMWTVFAFEADAPPDQALMPADPDGTVLEAAWVPVPEAIRRVARLSFRPRRDPLLHHLRNDTAWSEPRMWFWPDGTDADPVIVPVHHAE